MRVVRPGSTLKSVSNDERPSIDTVQVFVVEEDFRRPPDAPPPDPAAIFTYDPTCPPMVGDEIEITELHPDVFVVLRRRLSYANAGRERHLVLIVEKIV